MNTLCYNPNSENILSGSVQVKLKTVFKYSDLDKKGKKMDEQHEKYFKLRYEEGITDYKKVSHYLRSKEPRSEDIENQIQSYRRGLGIKGFYMEQLNVDSAKYEQIVQHFENFHTLWRQYYNDKRQVMLNYGEFMQWWRDQGNKCGYCGITQDKLHKLVELRGGNLTLNRGTKRSKGTLEIDKMDSGGQYEVNNMILCCPFCNNAKSNLISKSDWCKYFKKPMKEYLYAQLAAKQ